jgi:hypothetical protein
VNRILALDRIARVADLVGTAEPREASGVIVRGGRLLVVSDNTGKIAILDPGLARPGHEVRLRGGRGRDYEDLAADPAGGRLFVVVEEVRDGSRRPTGGSGSPRSSCRPSSRTTRASPSQAT